MFCHALTSVVVAFFPYVASLMNKIACVPRPVDPFVSVWPFGGRRRALSSHNYEIRSKTTSKNAYVDGKQHYIVQYTKHDQRKGQHDENSRGVMCVMIIKTAASSVSTKPKQQKHQKHRSGTKRDGTNENKDIFDEVRSVQASAKKDPRYDQTKSVPSRSRASGRVMIGHEHARRMMVLTRTKMCDY